MVFVVWNSFRQESGNSIAPGVYGVSWPGVKKFPIIIWAPYRSKDGWLHFCVFYGFNLIFPSAAAAAADVAVFIFVFVVLVHHHLPAIHHHPKTRRRWMVVEASRSAAELD